MVVVIMGVSGAGSGAEWSAQIREVMARGALVPDRLMYEIISQRLRLLDCKRGFIMNSRDITNFRSARP